MAAQREERAAAAGSPGMPGVPGSPSRMAAAHGLSSPLAAREAGMGARGPAGLGSVRRAAQRAAVPRLCLHAHMRGHGGCVNTVAWDECGEALLSGSDDLSLCVWRAADLTLRARARTAHSNNIFCARFVPGSGCARAVSCAADGAVRLVHLPADGSSIGSPGGMRGGDSSDELIAQWDGMLMKFAFAPGSSDVFVTTQQDGAVRCYDLRARLRAANGAGAPASRPTTRRRHVNLIGGAEEEGAGGGLRSISTVSTSDVCFDPMRPETMAVASDADHVVLYDIRRAGEVAAIHPRDWSSGSGASADTGLEGLAVTSARMLQPAGTLGCHTEGVSGIDYDSRGRLLISYRGGHMYVVDTRAAGRGVPQPREDRWAGGSGSGGRETGGPSPGSGEGGGDEDPQEELGGPGNNDREGEDEEDEGDLLSTAALERMVRASDEATMDVFVRLVRERQAKLRRRQLNKCETHFESELKGHLNRRTFLKEARFFGEGEYAACGSDCGHLFVYETRSGKLLRRIPADSSIVNCVAPHPRGLPILAVSGIDDDWRVLGPGSAHAVPPPEGVSVGDIAELSASSESHRLERASVATPLAQPGGAASCDAGVVLGSRIITRRRADMSLLGDSSDDYGGSDSMDEDYDTDTDEEEDDDADTDTDTELSDRPDEHSDATDTESTGTDTSAEDT